MPAGNGDALQALLIDKYGVLPEDAAAYAAQILGMPGDTHNDMLRSEALGNVVTQTLPTMRNLGRFPAAVDAAQGGPLNGITGADMDAAIELLGRSKMNTRIRAMQAGDQLRTTRDEPPAKQTEIIEVKPRVNVQADYVNPYEVKLKRAMEMRKAVLGF